MGHKDYRSRFRDASHEFPYPIRNILARLAFRQPLEGPQLCLAEVTIENRPALVNPPASLPQKRSGFDPQAETICDDARRLRGPAEIGGKQTARITGGEAFCRSMRLLQTNGCQRRPGRLALHPTDTIPRRFAMPDPQCLKHAQDYE
ncbi:hypothetical protein MNO81_03970 [Mycolicibacterium gadium]|uniref:Uncharacterized protein n=1 Tax=Mycolicibacterium gadium TaxID=1794 RepID=A0ABT6GKQ6_MYCGU|nr:MULTISPECIES: hypothetical protein [Mycobacteriaceae]MDG5481952.1 hypothetical protein [Mycolicibacterium gadium]